MVDDICVDSVLEFVRSSSFDMRMIVACVLVDLDIGWENRGIEGIVISGVVTEFAHFIDFRDNVYYIKKFFQIFFGVGV